MEEITQERLQKEESRFKTLLKAYDQLIHSFSAEFQSSLYLNKKLLACAVRSYFDDIEKFTLYSQSAFADNHKQAAYTIKWISKFRPIQILQETPITYESLEINGLYAIFAGFIFLGEGFWDKISPKLLDNLIYTTQYRNISGKQLATSLYILECAIRDKNP